MRSIIYWFLTRFQWFSDENSRFQILDFSHSQGGEKKMDNLVRAVCEQLWRRCGDVAVWRGRLGWVWLCVCTAAAVGMLSVSICHVRRGMSVCHLNSRIDKKCVIAAADATQVAAGDLRDNARRGRRKNQRRRRRFRGKRFRRLWDACCRRSYDVRISSLLERNPFLLFVC